MKQTDVYDKRIEVARRQIDVLAKYRGDYEYVVYRGPSLDGKSVKMTVFGPNGIKDHTYRAMVTYILEVFRTFRDIIMEEHGRVPMIDEMIGEWKRELARLVELSKSPRQYITRSRGIGHVVDQ